MFTKKKPGKADDKSKGKKLAKGKKPMGKAAAGSNPFAAILAASAKK